MKKHTYVFHFFILNLFYMPALVGQVSQIPYLQNFEEPFVLSPDGCNKQDCMIEFLPGWLANEVSASSRIYQDSLPNNAGKVISLVPTSTFSPEVIVGLNLSLYESLILQIDAASSKNGGEKDTRATLLYVSLSVDRGLSYQPVILVDSFMNVKSANFRTYNIMLKGTEKLNNAQILLEAKRSATGSGRAAKLFLDNVALGNELTGIAITHYEKKVSITAKDDSYIYLDKPITAVLFNNNGQEVNNIHSGISLMIKNLPKGLYFLKTEGAGSLKVMIE